MVFRRFCKMDSTLFGITPPGEGWVIDRWQKPHNSLRWRHNWHNSVSNHQPHHYLLTRLFGCRSKKTSKLCVTGLCAGNSPGTGEFPAQMVSNAENVSIWWRHHITSPVCHNAPCTSLFWMVHCGMWVRCIVGFVNEVYYITHENGCN